MRTNLSPITDKQAESINGGFLDTSVTQTGNTKANAYVGQGFFVGVGSIKVKL